MADVNVPDRYALIWRLEVVLQYAAGKHKHEEHTHLTLVSPSQLTSVTLANMIPQSFQDSFKVLAACIHRAFANSSVCSKWRLHSAGHAQVQQSAPWAHCSVPLVTSRLSSWSHPTLYLCFAVTNVESLSTWSISKA